MTGRHPALPFLARFVVLAAAFYAFTTTGAYQEGILPVISGWQARLSGGVLAAVGYDVVVAGNEVRGPSLVLSIREGCDAVEATALLVAACLAFPAAWGARVAGAVGGVGMLFVLNVVRVVSLYLIGVHARAWFHTAHVDLWPTLILVEAVALWAWWAHRVGPA